MSTVVIGAGLAGTFAARALAQAGEDVVVLEATSHLGGRTRTNREVLEHGQVADLGGSFIDIGQDLLLQFCVDNDIELKPEIRMFPKGPGERYSGASILLGHVVSGERRLGEDERAAIAQEVQDALDAVPPTDTETLKAWVRRASLSPRAAAAYVMQGAFNPTARSELVSSWHVHPGDIGRICWILADGTDTMARVASSGLDVRIDTPVRLVERAGGTYRVHTDADVLNCDNVVVSASVQATRRIGFDPVLPSWKIEALLGTPLSQGGKAVGQYRGGAAIAAAAGPSTMTDGPVSMFWLKQGPDDTVIAMGTMADLGDGMLDDEEATLSSLDRHIEVMTGTSHERIAGVVQNWTTEEFFGGVVNLGTGGFARRAALGAAVGGIHFAGEATGEWPSAMEGAARSGLRVAAEILQKRRAHTGLVPA
ncbi:FAD-dependent oxidoreductase [Nocardioides panacisoli]|uniref:flavin monoamine oxidase family protein n=1 Tax=Nocardioides panacisoli TaxID=627624 RepID=UPI001C63724B|nr:NAD(P)/FAD-dependent oxidoreductase [Nocardioides panacisoli]QYJ03523.1 FAD-dependent oxidoreductase [Nocardioides panacisoli]